MKEQISQMFVIFLAASFMIGSFFSDFVTNERLLFSMTLAALSFTLLDLSKVLKFPTINNYIFLLLAVFSIVVVPYLDFLYKQIGGQSNRLTIIGLSIVILIIGIRQLLEEREDLKQVNNYIDKLDSINQDLQIKMDEQTKIIKELNQKLNEKNNSDK
ncbi:hypothetical protein [Bacillus cereus]|uniref:hypothetical protein n=1 Tax=Bacillus cereus TaxID=1396 RepID=UPI000937F76C|nr:hypothetical protein [Bacillus cereus]OKA27489.1 hypothetical protein BJR05_16310 [Bacillus cereus]